MNDHLQDQYVQLQVLRRPQVIGSFSSQILSHNWPKRLRKIQPNRLLNIRLWKEGLMDVTKKA